MSTSIVLNDGTPAPAPTSGCCASISDAGTPGNVAASVNGTAGTGSSNVGGLSASALTGLYYIGKSGDYDAQQMVSGNWTVPLHVGTSNITGLTLDSIYVCHANSSGASLGTIGSLTSIGQALAPQTTYSFTVSGAAVTFGTGDVPIISFQFHDSSGTLFQVGHDQTVTAPTMTPLPVNLLLPRVVRSDCDEPGGVYRSAPPPFLLRTAGSVPPPRVVRFDTESAGLAYRTRLPMMPTAPMHPLSPRAIYFDEPPTPGVVYRTPLLAPPVPGAVPPPRVVRFDEPPIDGVAFRTPVLPVINLIPVAGGVLPPRIVRFDEPPYPGAVFRPTPIPVTPAAHPGVLILFYRGPKADLPILKKGEPGWCTDTNQLFVGDGFTNHFVGGMASAMPAHTNSPGYFGEYATDGSNLAICYALNSWVKFAGGSTAF